MTNPLQYLYSKEHTWASADADGAWLVGITDYAQEMLGDVVFVDPPKVGQRIVQGHPCGLVESVKTGSDLVAPLSGTVAAINEALASNPELLNDHPYATWIFKLHPSVDGVDALLDAAAYQLTLG